MNENRPVLHTDNLTVGYGEAGRQGTQVFGGINIDARRSELVALFGPNGIGKSTLLKSLVRLLRPLSGKICLHDTDINDYTAGRLARMVGYVSTDPVRVNNLKVYDLVSLGRYPHTGWMGRLGNKDMENVEEALEMVGITGLMNKQINRLSDGERQRAMIARTLAQDTGLIVLDEPTAFLDLPNKYEIVHLLHRLAAEKGRTVIFSTHDLSIAIQEASKIWLMLPGQMHQGAPEDLILGDQFGKMFENTNLSFSTGKGEFRIKRELRETIGLRGPAAERRWTRNALERNGFRVAENEECETTISIDKTDGIRTWKLTMQGSDSRFTSIYDLCSYLISSI